MIKIIGRELTFENESWIKKVKYNIDTKAMLVNDQYEHPDVPLETFIELAMADSKGKYFNDNVKGKYLHKFFKKSE